VDYRLTVSAVQPLLAGIALEWPGACLAIRSLCAPDAYVRGSMRVACFAPEMTIFVGGIVPANR